MPAVGRAQAQLDEKGLAVRLALGEPLPAASAEPAAVGQIMDNLLANAALRSPQGGGITVEADVRADTAGAHAVVISVHDHGNQITPGTGVLEIDGAASTPVSLKVVRLLSARQGGRAWAESGPVGARFVVRLPVRRAA